MGTTLCSSPAATRAENLPGTPGLSTHTVEERRNNETNNHLTQADLSDKHWEAVAQEIGLPEGMSTALLRQAFTHASFAREANLGATASNQRLEFLGDAVLDVILVEYLYLRHPDVPEGQLTKMKATAARSQTLARIARQLHLGTYLLLGRGEQETGGREKPSLLADSFEALVGAIYLAAGLETTRSFILSRFEQMLAEIEAQSTIYDHKTSLQELLQEHAKQTPSYVTVQTLGPPHDRTFVVRVQFRGMNIGEGQGSSKQAAQQAAARHALETQQTWLPEALAEK